MGTGGLAPPGSRKELRLARELIYAIYYLLLTELIIILVWGQKTSNSRSPFRPNLDQRDDSAE
jgi:hypothetical protein